MPAERRKQSRRGIYPPAERKAHRGDGGPAGTAANEAAPAAADPDRIPDK